MLGSGCSGQAGRRLYWRRYTCPPHPPLPLLLQRPPAAVHCAERNRRRRRTGFLPACRSRRRQLHLSCSPVSGDAGERTRRDPAIRMHLPPGAACRRLTLLPALHSTDGCASSSSSRLEGDPWPHARVRFHTGRRRGEQRAVGWLAVPQVRPAVASTYMVSRCSQGLLLCYPCQQRGRRLRPDGFGGAVFLAQLELFGSCTHAEERSHFLEAQPRQLLLNPACAQPRARPVLPAGAAPLGQLAAGRTRRTKTLSWTASSE